MAVGGGAVLGGCRNLLSGGTGLGGEGSVDYTDGRLRERPRSTIKLDPDVPTRLHPVGFREERDAYLFVPESVNPKNPSPLVVTLHGANAWGRGGTKPFIDLAEEAGVILASPSSEDRTWDVIHGGFGPDVAFVDRTLEFVFERYRIDEARLGVLGFSDGATYALSLGITNGDLFSHVIAMSPGFMAPGEPHGKPPIFISHGIGDNVLPIDRTSRAIVPELKEDGYDILYREFDGGHAHPPEIEQAALDWFLR